MQLSLFALPLALLATAAQAQTMRPFTTFRQMHGETRLAARLEYAAGSLRLGPGDTDELYRMDLSYDNDRFVPLSDFDSPRGAVVLGLRAAGNAGVRVVSRNQLEQVAAVSFSPRVDLSLDANLGAADAELDFGGLRVSRLEVQTGASRSMVRFSQPNLVRCSRAAFTAGAAELTIIGLGNSRCDEIEFEGGMGKVTLDFSGAWSSSAHVKVQMAVGELTLRLPRTVGVRVSMDKFLASFEPAGFVRQGEGFQTVNYNRAQRHLDLELTTAIGGVNVQWLD